MSKLASFLIIINTNFQFKILATIIIKILYNKHYNKFNIKDKIKQNKIGFIIKIFIYNIIILCY